MHTHEHKFITVVKRSEIPEITKVVQGNEVIDLGSLRDFGKCRKLKSFIPRDKSNISMSWVRLSGGQKLQPHTHPVRSMILVTSGEVEVLGDTGTNQIAGASTGDCVLIESNLNHGFIGLGENGFEGLSIQFETEGLYSNPRSPLTNFKPTADGGSIDTLLEFNRRKQDEFTANPFFVNLERCKESGSFNIQAFHRHFFFWSKTFKEVVELKHELESDPRFKKVFAQHLDEEKSHHSLISNWDNDESLRIDPIFESYCLWFKEQMHLLSGPEKVACMHLCVETTADEFYARAGFLFNDSAANTEHLNLHLEHDYDHSMMGVSLMNELSPQEKTSVFETLERSWKVMNEFYNRLNEICCS